MPFFVYKYDFAHNVHGTACVHIYKSFAQCVSVHVFIYVRKYVCVHVCMFT